MVSCCLFSGVVVSLDSLLKTSLHCHGQSWVGAVARVRCIVCFHSYYNLRFDAHCDVLNTVFRPYYLYMVCPYLSVANCSA